MTETDSPEHAAGASRALSFDGAAAQYAAARPGYPAALFDAVEELAGLPLRDARTLDVGAGTGISTRRLHDRGARVVAVEPGPGMAAELRRSLPHVPLVRGDGNSLPFAGASADLITYAQSYHWTDRARSTPRPCASCGPAARSPSGGTSPTTPSRGSPTRTPGCATSSATKPGPRTKVPTARPPAPAVCCPNSPSRTAVSPGPGASPWPPISPTSPATPPSWSSARNAPGASSTRSASTSRGSSRTARSRRHTSST